MIISCRFNLGVRVMQLLWSARKALVAMSLIAASLAGRAYAEGPGPLTDIVVRSPPTWNQEVQTSQFMAPILRQPFYAARAVQLPEAVTLHFGRHALNLPAGQILTTIGESRYGVFCMTEPGDWLHTARYFCLIDADSDGSFESQQEGSNNYRRIGQKQLLVIAANRQFTDACLDGEITQLVNRIPYTEIDPTRGPAGDVLFFYELHHSSEAGDGPHAAGSGMPNSISLSVYLGHASTGNPVNTEPVTYQLDTDGRGEIDFLGAHFSIQGVNSSGRLIYRVTRLMPDQTVQVPPPGITETITFSF